MPLFNGIYLYYYSFTDLMEGHMAVIKHKGKLISAVLNNQFIKMMEVTKAGKQIHVHRAVTIPTPIGTVNDGVLTDINKIAAAMQQAMKDKGFTATSIVFSVSSTKIATKEVIIPAIKESKIEKLVEANAPEYFPVNIQDYIIEYSILEKIDDEGVQKFKLMVAALNSSTAQSYYELAKILGYNLLYLDYTGNSAYQLVRHQITSDVNLVVEIENDGTVVNIFKNNVLKLQRIVPYGKSLIIDAIKQEYNLEYKEALVKLQEESLLHSEFDGDEITESIRYLVGNINRIMDYYTSRNKGDEIAKAYILGNATTIKGFNELLSNEIKKEVTNIIKLNNIVCDKKTKFEKRRLNSYLNNLGALIEPVNFRPKDLVAKESNKEEFKTLKLVLAVAVIASIFLISYPLARKFILDKRVSELKTSIKNKSEIVEIVDNYYGAKDKYLDAKAFSSLTTNNDDCLESLITCLEKELPSDVVIDNLTINSGKATITGSAGSKLSVAKTISQLSAISGLTEVDVPSIQESKDSTDTIVVTFSLSFSFNNVTVDEN